MKWNNDKLHNYSLITAIVCCLCFLFVFGTQPFGCTPGRKGECLSVFAIVIVVAYLASYAFLWFLTRFGNLKGVDSKDEF